MVWLFTRFLTYSSRCSTATLPKTAVASARTESAISLISNGIGFPTEVVRQNAIASLRFLTFVPPARRRYASSSIRMVSRSLLELANWIFCPVSVVYSRTQFPSALGLPFAFAMIASRCARTIFSVSKRSSPSTSAALPSMIFWKFAISSDSVMVRRTESLAARRYCSRLCSVVWLVP